MVLAIGSNNYCIISFVDILAYSILHHLSLPVSGVPLTTGAETHFSVSQLLKPGSNLTNMFVAVIQMAGKEPSHIIQ